jgi:DNA modification methylase
MDWPADKVERRKVADLIPYARNSRTHSDKQVAASIREWGWTMPVLVDEVGNLIAGHGRIMAAQKLGIEEVPCMTATGWSEAKRRAYVIADNKLALNADWDNEALGLEIQDLKVMGFDIELTGFELDEIEGLFPEEPTAGLTDEDAVPEVPEVPVTVEGDVWLLGRHRLMCGDSTRIDAVERLMDGKKAALLHADPPYGMGKEGDGVANDNLYQEKLDAFQMEWWATFRTFLEDNASAYIWGNAPDLWRLWYQGGLADSEDLHLQNEIVWAKPSGFGQSSEGMRSYAASTERCLFFLLGVQGYNNNSENYWDGFEPIRAYLEGERNAMDWKNQVVAKFFGFHPRMADHWFSRSQWSFPKKEQYEKLQQESNGQAFRREYDDLKCEYDDLKREYDDLKQEFYATRAYFDNTHDNMNEVWGYGRVNASERHGHATPKPVSMMERVMRSSLPQNGLCVEPFGGSGSTIMGAEKTGRACYTMELQPKYCDVIIRRWQDFTGQTATLESTGQTFTELKAEREAA